MAVSLLFCCQDVATTGPTTRPFPKKGAPGGKSLFKRGPGPGGDPPQGKGGLSKRGAGKRTSLVDFAAYKAWVGIWNCADFATPMRAPNLPFGFYPPVPGRPRQSTYDHQIVQLFALENAAQPLRRGRIIRAGRVLPEEALDLSS